MCLNCRLSNRRTVASRINRGAQLRRNDGIRHSVAGRKAHLHRSWASQSVRHSRKTGRGRDSWRRQGSHCQKIPQSESESGLNAVLRRITLHTCSQFYPARQKITLKDSKNTLNDEATLVDAGVVDGGELLVKDLGHQISWKTVFLVEYVSRRVKVALSLLELTRLKRLAHL